MVVYYKYLKYNLLIMETMERTLTCLVVAQLLMSVGQLRDKSAYL